MGKIKVLDKSVSNIISAGEVVEKPRSVVKELVENSIDAGATSVTIEIEEGGIKKICVIDNGCGIERSDIKTAFLPHATSKISIASDLDLISTLGFRGEALASIAAVSQVEMTTKTFDEPLATKILIEGGEVKSFEEAVANVGTKICVNNLFFNTPARKKFLRKPKTEENEITHLIQKFMLVYSNVKFKYIVDGKVIYDASSSKMLDIVYEIYGQEMVDNLLCVNYKTDKYSVAGYLGKPDFSKTNRTFQTLIVNNRVADNFLVTKAVEFGYKDFLMKGKFPVFILNFTVPLSSVDVNVHPTKQEVKFDNNGEIYDFFYTLTREALIKNATTVSEVKVNLKSSELDQFSDVGVLGHGRVVSKDEANAKIDFKPLDLQNNFFDKEEKLFNNVPKIFGEQIQVKVEGKDVTLSKTELTGLMDDGPYQRKEKSELKQISVLKDIDKTKILSTIFNTYILAEKDENLYIIDQHACHERILYDKFMKEVSESSNIAQQELLVPFAFSCSQPELSFFNESAYMIEKLGFKFEVFGTNSIIVTHVPFTLMKMNIGYFIDEIKRNIDIFSSKSEDFVKEQIAQTACKHAVKAGDVLPKENIASLIKSLETTKILLCPHGRPIILKISKTEIEKMFKRIVS